MSTEGPIPKPVANPGRGSEKIRTTITAHTAGNDEVPIAPNELRVYRSRYNEASSVQLTGEIIGNREPARNRLLAVTVNGKRIAGVTTTRWNRRSDGLVYIEGFDARRKLKTNRVTKTYTDAQMRTIFVDICNEANVKSDIRFSPEFEKLSTIPTFDIELFDTTCEKALNRLNRVAGGYVYVDTSNTVVFTDLSPTDFYALTSIKESDAGRAVPPYNKVVVLGRTVKDGKFRKQAIRGSAGVGNNVYTYEDNAVKSTAQADDVAARVLEEFEAQRAAGTVTIVGDGRLSPWDVAQLPDGPGRRLTGDEYMVGRVTHTLDFSDGYITEIEVDALPPETLPTGTDPAKKRRRRRRGTGGQQPAKEPEPDPTDDVGTGVR